MNTLKTLSTLALISLAGCSTVDTGNRGVVLDWGKPTGEIKSEGVYTLNPFSTSIKEMNVQVVAKQVDCSAFSSDTQHITVRIVVNYQLDPGKVDKLYDQVRDEYEDRLVVPSALSACTQTISHFNATSLTSERDKVASSIDTILQQKLTPYGINVPQTQITDLEFTKEFQDAVEAKVQAQQEYQTALTQAKTAVVQAEANAKSQQAQHLTLTKELLEKMWIEKWDGHLPTYSGGPLPLIQIPGEK